MKKISVNKEYSKFKQIWFNITQYILNMLSHKSNTMSYAEREFTVLKKQTPDAVIVPYKSDILRLVNTFGNSGQSGGSAPYTVKIITQALEHLLLQRPITELTGESSEWRDVSRHSGGNCFNLYQNKRNGEV